MNNRIFAILVLAGLLFVGGMAEAEQVVGKQDLLSYPEHVLVKINPPPGGWSEVRVARIKLSSWPEGDGDWAVGKAISRHMRDRKEYTILEVYLDPSRSKIWVIYLSRPSTSKLDKATDVNTNRNIEDDTTAVGKTK